MKRMTKNWPPFKDLEPLRYCYVLWAGEALCRSKDGKIWEMYHKGYEMWTTGEFGAVTYYLSCLIRDEEFKLWKDRTDKIKLKQYKKDVDNFPGRHLGIY